jgi:hypothetical protein
MAVAGISRALPAAAGVASRLLKPLAQNMIQGAAAGGFLAVPEERGSGAALGAIGGAVLRGGAKLLGKGARGIIQATPAAKYLQSKGVDLTIGQQAPRSAIGQFEEAGQSVGGIGPSIAAQRQAGREAWQGAILKQVAPTGTAVPTTGDVPSRLASVYQGFDAAYAPVKGVSIFPAIHAGGKGIPLQGSKGAFRKAVTDPAAMAPRDTQIAVDRFLQNELSILPTPKGALPKVPAGSLLKIRSNIRGAIREAGQAQDFPRARLLENAESAVTDTLETQLPKDAAALLRAADAKYAQYKIAESAVRRAGDVGEGFTPSQLSMSVRQGTEPGQYARGGGGELRKLAAAGREVFDVRSPPTGARYLTVGPFGWVTAPVSAAANQPLPKALLTGQTAAQRRATAYIEALRRGLGPRGINAVRTSGAVGTGATMQEE